MPKPPPRTPQLRSPEASAVTEPASLAPAPTNGVPYGSQPSDAGRPVVKRRGKQLNARIPVELYERLASCSAATRIPQGRLLERALDAELKTHGF